MAVPGEAPNTVPPALTVATAVFEELHVPPLPVVVYDDAAVWQKLSTAADTTPGLGPALTVTFTTISAVAVPSLTRMVNASVPLYPAVGW